MNSVRTFEAKRRACAVLALSFLVLSVIFSVFAMPVRVYAAETSDSVTSVTIMKDGENIEVLATLGEKYLSDHKGSPVYLFEVASYHSTDSLSDHEPAAEARASSKMTFKISLSSGTRSRISSRFVIAEKNHDGSYNAIGNAIGISNPEAVAKASYIYPSSDSKKGLSFSELSDAELLSASSTVIKVPFNEYFLAESGENTVSYLCNGKTYYFNRSMINDLDSKVRICSNSGITVYIQVLLSPLSNCTFDALSALYYSNAGDEASYYAINTGNENGAAYFEAFMKFAVSRYTSADREFGFAGSYIIGSDVNSNRSGNNMGEQSLESYTENYAALFRSAYSISRAVYSNARLFVPISNNFTAKRTEPGSGAKDTLDYPAKSFLSEFNRIIQSSGNLGWSVAISPNASDRMNPYLWLDSLAENNLETPYITMSNLDILSRFLTQPEFLYSGDVRRVIIYDFSIATPASSDAISAASAERTQAAAYVYSYYKALANSYVDAIIYDGQFDSPKDGTAFGLWTVENGERKGKKFIYGIFEAIDREDISPLTDFALPILGVSALGDAIESIGSSVKPPKFFIDGSTADNDELGKKHEENLLFDFTCGDTAGFTVGENAEYVELRGGDSNETTLLYAALDSSDPYAYMGISASFQKGFVLDDPNYLTLHIKPDAPRDVSEVSVVLRLYSRGGASSVACSYTGRAVISPGFWSDVTFDIGKFSEKTGNTVDSIKIWIKPTDEKYHEGSYGFALRTISSWSKKGLSLLSVILICILVIVLLVAGFFAFIFIKGWIKRRKRIRRKQKLAEFRDIERKRSERQLRRTLERMFPDSEYLKGSASKDDQSRKRSSDGKNRRGGE